MAYRKWWLACLFAFTVCDGVTSDSVLCEAGFCRTYGFEVGCSTPGVNCGINNATHSGLWMLSPTECNCCEFCLGFILEGQPCSLGGPGEGTTVGRCGPGLSCMTEAEGNRCRRIQSQCHTLQDEYDERHARGDAGFLEERPKCDDKGRFAPTACVTTQTCYCQSEEGNRLFGEDEYRGSNALVSMQCGCSRLNHHIETNIAPSVGPPVTPRCIQNGDFNPVQCNGRTCRCVNRITGIVEGNSVINLDTHPISDLPCYDASLDTFAHLTPADAEAPYNYTSPCLEERERRASDIADSEQEGYNVDFHSSTIQCLPDASYHRVRTELDGRKICTTAGGDPIEDYVAFPGTVAFDEMDCNCALTSLLLLSRPERPLCCQNGNFRPVQCRRGMCYCVNNHGRQLGKENSDVTQLPCYTQSWRTC